MPTSDLRVIDAHLHQWSTFSDPANVANFLERTPEARWLVLASDLRGGYYPSAKEIDDSNECTLRYVGLFPERVKGWCYVNPRWPSACDQLRRGIEAGLLGLKLWVATRCSDPVTFPVVEAAIKLDIPMLVHTYRKVTGNLAEESLPTDMAELACLYPDGRFLMAHMGGDWEFGLRAIRNCPNVWVDFSGTINEYGAYEMAIQELGEDRVVFGTDLPADFHVNLGRVLQGGWEDRVLTKVLAGNFDAMLGSPLPE